MWYKIYPHYCKLTLTNHAFYITQHIFVDGNPIRRIIYCGIVGVGIKLLEGYSIVWLNHPALIHPRQRCIITNIVVQIHVYGFGWCNKFFHEIGALRFRFFRIHCLFICCNKIEKIHNKHFLDVISNLLFLVSTEIDYLCCMFPQKNQPHLTRGSLCILIQQP